MFVGDIVGRPGRNALKEHIYGLLESLRIDFVVVNAENAAGGFGITEKAVMELFSHGVHVLTSGNHIWDKKEAEPILANTDNIIRPLNYAPGVPGRGSVVYDLPGRFKVGVINLQGRVFMPLSDCPFRAVEAEVKRISAETDIIVVDFHAEATSEKLAMGWFLDGKVSAVIGTHTHVQTADERVLPGGTAYITDVGMTGPTDSVIGVKVQQVMHRFLLQTPSRFEVAKKGPTVMSAVVVAIDESTGRATDIKRLSLKHTP